VVKRRVDRSVPGDWWALPVVAETWDGRLNDINGLHVKPQHAFEALDTATSGAVTEGSVGGGTGMICFGFKGGIGTASRKLDAKSGGYTLGVLVQCNCGRRTQLQIAGVPVGAEIEKESARQQEHGSIIIVIATDAPLMPHQLKRLARRATMGLARDGSTSGNGSGDIFLAFTTANPGAAGATDVSQIAVLPNERMNPLFDAVVQATEEAIVNAMFAAETMIGINGNKVEALPLDRVHDLLKKHNRLSE
jgi:L-aminopeptidase/D-esterase-like protein